MEVTSVSQSNSLESQIDTSETMFSYVPSYICPMPVEIAPEIIDGQSIMIEDQGSEFIVGSLASVINPNSPREYGGNLKNRQFQRLVKALTAKVLGQGEHTLNIAISASLQHLDSFREKKGVFRLSEENAEILKSIVSEIKFKNDSTDGKWKFCHVTVVEIPHCIYEFQAVIKALPTNYKTFYFQQYGWGDIQQATLVDGKLMVNSLARVEGLSGAFRIFMRLTGLSSGEAYKAWMTNKMPEAGGMNGKTFDCTELKKKSIRMHISTVKGELLNKNHDYQNRTKHVINSGGILLDELAYEVVLEEMFLGSNYVTHKINELKEGQTFCLNPLYACVEGLLQFKTNGQKILALDIGNSSLKGGAM